MTRPTCTVCSLLSSLSAQGRQEVNRNIIDRSITAADAARLLTKHLSPVGVTTVKKHRKEDHSV